MTDTPASTPASSPASPKKRSLGKLFLKLCGVLVVLFIVGIVVLYFSRNILVAHGVVYGGKYATDQETLLDAANLQLGGTLDLSQLKIHNPGNSGYKEAHFLQMKSCNVAVQPGSFLSNTIVVDKIDITGLEINVEQNGAKNNLAELLSIMQAKSPAAAPAPASGGKSAPPTSPGRSLKIALIHMGATKVHLRGMVQMDLDLPEFQLDDITNPDGRPTKIADVMVKILLHVAQQILNNPALPGDFRAGLKDASALVNNLKGNLDKSLKDVTKNLDGAGKQLQNLGNDAGKQLQGLQGLIPGSKPPVTQPK